VGRHFRLSPLVKAIVGRDEGENHFLERFRADRWRLAAVSDVGPVTLVTGSPDDGQIMTAASLTARYGDGRDRETVEVKAERFGAADPGIPEVPAETRMLTASPAVAAEDLARLRVGI